MESDIPAKVSVIVPAYNASRFILVAIESLLNQSHNNIEIIVVDDGSTDNTRVVLEELISRGVIHYTHQENQGASAARNKGISLAGGEFIGFLDADDKFDPQMVSTCLEYIITGSYDLVSVDNYLIHQSGDEEMGRDIEQYPWIEKEPEELFLEFLKVGGIGGVHKALFRKTLFDRVGLLDVTLPVYEDLDLWIRIAMHGMKWGHIRQTLVHYYRRDENSSLFTTSPQRNQDCRVRILRRYQTTAIERSPEMREILAGQLWDYGRAYVTEYGSSTKAIICFFQSMVLQPNLTRLLKSLNNFLLARAKKT